MIRYNRQINRCTNLFIPFVTQPNFTAFVHFMFPAACYWTECSRLFSTVCRTQAGDGRSFWTRAVGVQRYVRCDLSSSSRMFQGVSPSKSCSAIRPSLSFQHAFRPCYNLKWDSHLVFAILEAFSPWSFSAFQWHLDWGLSYLKVPLTAWVESLTCSRTLRSKPTSTVKPR